MEEMGFPLHLCLFSALFLNGMTRYHFIAIRDFSVLPETVRYSSQSIIF